MTTPLDRFLNRAEELLTRLEALLPAPPPAPDWNRAVAFRWRKPGKPGKHNAGGYLQALPNIAPLKFSDLHRIAEQKAAIDANTQQFIARKPANNVLLTGARGTGKSSLIKACLQQYQTQGLRMVEVDKMDLIDLPDIVELLAARPERFILFCDDLGFEEGEYGYKALKVALDGSIATTPENVLIYATSNRRHLLPERFSDNETYHRSEKGDLHPGETVEEKIALSERFGLWLSFYPFRQEDYLAIVAHWMKTFGCNDQQIQAAIPDALRWTLSRGSRSGRVAWQFAKDFAGKNVESIGT